MTLLHMPSPAASTASGFSNTNALNNVKSIVFVAVPQNKDSVLLDLYEDILIMFHSHPLDSDDVYHTTTV